MSRLMTIAILPTSKLLHTRTQSAKVDVIDKIKECAKGATPYPLYKFHFEVPFVSEILQFEGWRAIVSPVVQT